MVLSVGISIAPPPYTPGEEVYFQAYPAPFVSSFIQTYGPWAFDYTIIAVFFLILAAAYFIAAKIMPTPRLTTKKA